MSKEQLLEKINARVEKLRAKWGYEICTDAVLNGDIIEYTFMPDDVTGYTVEIDCTTMKTRHHGNGKGCFWTEWVEF